MILGAWTYTAFSMKDKALLDSDLLDRALSLEHAQSLEEIGDFASRMNILRCYKETRLPCSNA